MRISYKVLGLAAALILVFGILPLTAFAAEGSVNVGTAQELTDALRNPEVRTINLTRSFVVENAGAGANKGIFEIARAGVVLNGNGHSITAVDPTARGAHLLNITANHVRVNNLIVDGGGYTKHGINVWNAADVCLNGVTSRNNLATGLTVAGAEVTISGLLGTAGNGWGGVNVGKGTGTTVAPKLTFLPGAQYSSDSEVNGIYIDPGEADKTKEYISGIACKIVNVNGVNYGFGGPQADLPDCIVTTSEGLHAVLADFNVKEITLMADLVVEGGVRNTQGFTVSRPVTIYGNHRQITACGASTQQSLLKINSDNVVVHHLTLDGAGIALHGIHVQHAGGVELHGVTSKNNLEAGLAVSGSEVIAVNLTTENNGRASIHIGKGENSPKLTVKGEFSSNESTGIYLAEDGDAMRVEDCLDLADSNLKLTQDKDGNWLIVEREEPSLEEEITITTLPSSAVPSVPPAARPNPDTGVRAE